MVWEKPQYNKLQVNEAGKMILTGTSSLEDLKQSFKVLNNWRGSHSYPMGKFQMRLKRVAQKIDSSALTAQRLKRIPAIIYKLTRRYNGKNPTMKLAQMQDIGGCRVIVSNINLARQLYTDHYIKGNLKHRLRSKKDYINNPKEDGYRSFHLVYEYKSDKGKKEFNGLLVEVQIRSQMQHLWATAVETAGLFTRQAIKSNEGHPQWIEFFKLVSSVFAKIEGCPSVPGVYTNEKELYNKIKELEEQLHIIDKMSGWTHALKRFDEALKSSSMSKTKIKFFLLDLDIDNKKLEISNYTEKEESKALEAYAKIEERYRNNNNYDVVLVGVDNAKDLRKAYPNYFLDTAQFLSQLKKIINKASF